jgi:NifU-like protein
MSYYPPKVSERFRSPGHSGAPADANASGTSASFQCGCFVKISLLIEEEPAKVAGAWFQTNGCGFMAASADAAAEQLSGRELTGLRSLNEGEFIRSIEAELDSFPLERRQCARVVYEAARAAFAGYRSRLVQEFAGEKALICSCFGISEDTIVTFIETSGADSVEDVTAATRAGGGCGSCRMLIQEMIDEQALS